MPYDASIAVRLGPIRGILARSIRNRSRYRRRCTFSRSASSIAIRRRRSFGMSVSCVRALSRSFNFVVKASSDASRVQRPRTASHSALAAVYARSAAERLSDETRGQTRKASTYDANAHSPPSVIGMLHATKPPQIKPALRNKRMYFSSLLGGSTPGGNFQAPSDGKTGLFPGPGIATIDCEPPVGWLMV